MKSPVGSYLRVKLVGASRKGCKELQRRMGEVLPEATLESESALDMTYALPEEAMGRAPALFKEIEEMQSSSPAFRRASNEGLDGQAAASPREDEAEPLPLGGADAARCPPFGRL